MQSRETNRTSRGPCRHLLMDFSMGRVLRRLSQASYANRKYMQMLAGSTCKSYARHALRDAPPCRGYIHRSIHVSWLKVA